MNTSNRKCDHGRSKYHCKYCGISRCDHGNRKSRCLECGIGRCDHGRDKYNCRDCGTSICDHGNNKRYCQECGSGRCHHGNRKYRCRECSIYLCDHGRDKSRCRDCGTGLCDHNRYKQQCKICSPAECPKCLIIFSSNSIGPHRKCHTAGYDLRKKRKEESLSKFLIKSQVNFTREHHVDYRCIDNSAQNKFHRIDFLIVMNGILFFIEVDEFQHESYNSSCETSRMTRIYESLILEGNTLPIVFIRFNPDPYSVDDTAQSTSIRVRHRLLLEFINNFTTINPLSINYMFYNECDGIPVIIEDPDYPEKLKCCIIFNETYSRYKKKIH
jgi:hypothetical protein